MARPILACVFRRRAIKPFKLPPLSSITGPRLRNENFRYTLSAISRVLLPVNSDCIEMLAEWIIDDTCIEQPAIRISVRIDEERVEALLALPISILVVPSDGIIDGHHDIGRPRGHIG